MRRRIRLLITTTVLAAATVAVGTVATVGPAPVGAADAATAAKDLPPSGEAALRKLFDKQLAPLGVQVTRAVLQSLETYERDPSGTHLALYVEPMNAKYTVAQYVANFTPLTRHFVPKVFERWKGLESFDICQEPFGDPRESPPPITQIFVARDALDRVGSWKKASLTELIAASPRARNVSAGYYVYFSPLAIDDPTLAAARQEAGWTSASTTTGY